jgi:DNA-binding protein HU-beta
MTKAELIEKLQKGAGKELSKKELSSLMDEVFDHISKSVRKDKRFVYPGFGTFQLRKRAARVGRNPRTGIEIRIAASKTITFKPAPNLKSVL